MRRLNIICGLLILAGTATTAQELSRYIVVDHFGYRPGTRKVAVIRDPQVGFDAEESFTPGSWYAVVNATTGEKVYRAVPVAWGGGSVDASSGDRAWHFDFSDFDGLGTYYILDEQRHVRSYSFVIAHNVHNEILRQAMRTFYYQRVGFPKEAPYAGEAWTDGASHQGELQDPGCRDFFDPSNPATERDVSGGWYDAGDFNKYTNWTANYVVELMKAYLERPQAWGDDYNIPESGNGMPDILDEAIWGIDHLLRMQGEDGSVLSIVAEAHASPPSSATDPSYYGPPSTSATLNTSAAFAIASGVYREQGLVSYADTLLARALKAWSWAEAYPDSVFYNNNENFGSAGLGAGQQEVDDYGRDMARLEAACYLFGETGDLSFRDYVDNHYQSVHLLQWTFAYPFEALNQEMLLYYTTLTDGTVSVQDHIRDVYRSAVINGSENLSAHTTEKDPYLAHIKDYTWGSNGVKSSQGSMHHNLITYGMDEGVTEETLESAEAFIHYLHGVNPLNFVYLSNMYDYGIENGVNEFYHSWFADGSPLWDRVGESTHGPPPGFLTGGPNPGYDWADCCPSGCGSTSNNMRCYSESISPPRDQPSQKSYKDFNTSWPLNSWEVTENSCGYQVRYIRLLSKFVTAGMDCNGEVGGSAFMDSCGVCAGGRTGIIPSLDAGACGDPPEPPLGDTMYIEGRHLYTASGEKVILRGVNEMFVWSDDQDGELLLPEIAKTGANCVRLVWTEEAGNKGILVELMENCIDLKMIAKPECHSATGEWDKLDICVQFWKDPQLLEAVQRNKRWTLVNIGNEVGDGNVTAGQFEEGYKRAIDSLRSWGYTVPIVIDASTWGQNVDVIISTWEAIQAYDPLHNILFSVHSYWGDVSNYTRVANESINNGLPVIIGEGPSPTRYPTCELLDYGSGLQETGINEIGWLLWSWGGLANGHCVPNFDMATDGVFGNWRTAHAADLAVNHDYSLMRTAERPSSFYEDDTVRVAGIYYSPETDTLWVGDSVLIEGAVTPVNAVNRGITFQLMGDTDAVSFDMSTGLLIALGAGIVQLTAISQEDPTITFTRTLEVFEIPVTSIVITPSVAEMTVGDSLQITVDLFPEDATVKEYLFEVTGSMGIISLDTLSGWVVAQQAGSAQIAVTWINGDVTDTLHITVTEPVYSSHRVVQPQITLYPNPNEGMLLVECSQQVPLQIRILTLDGRVILEERYTGQTVIDTTLFPPGAYLVVHTGVNLLQREILIIQ